MNLKQKILSLFQQTQTTLWGVRLLFIAAPKESSILSLLVFLQGVIPACSLFIIQGIINWIFASSSGMGIFPWGLVIAWGGILLIGTIINSITSVIQILDPDLAPSTGPNRNRNSCMSRSQFLAFKSGREAMRFNLTN